MVKLLTNRESIAPEIKNNINPNANNNEDLFRLFCVSLSNLVYNVKNPPANIISKDIRYTIVRIPTTELSPMSCRSPGDI